jgi:hypothetical protein
VHPFLTELVAREHRHELLAYAARHRLGRAVAPYRASRRRRWRAWSSRAVRFAAAPERPCACVVGCCPAVCLSRAEQADWRPSCWVLAVVAPRWGQLIPVTLASLTSASDGRTVEPPPYAPSPAVDPHAALALHR